MDFLYFYKRKSSENVKPKMEKIGPADLQRSLKIEENAFLRLG